MNINKATQIYQLRFYKEEKASQQRKDSVSKKGVGTNTHAKKKKNLDTDLTLFIKTDPQLIIDWNSKHKTIKEDNIGEKSWWSWVWWWVFR